MGINGGKMRQKILDGDRFASCMARHRLLVSILVLLGIIGAWLFFS